MNRNRSYPIGTPGRAWGDAERAEWLARQQIKRSYADEVVARLTSLKEHFDVNRYGALPVDPSRYPLFVARSRPWQRDRPRVLITGGVHGYETSGVHGALRFLIDEAPAYFDRFNFIGAPCVSPWGYETVNRWNPGAVDPNRSFQPGLRCDEASALMRLMREVGGHFVAHFDLHETTDTDNTEFRPALAARDGKSQEVRDIPDGFYTVGDRERPQPGFQQAIIQSVERVTHIAPPTGGTIIGEPLQHWGVIHYPARKLGLCMGMTDSPYVTTTEVYPDSSQVDDEICIRAQVAAVVGGLDFLSQKAAH